MMKCLIIPDSFVSCGKTVISEHKGVCYEMKTVKGVVK